MVNAQSISVSLDLIQFLQYLIEINIGGTYSSYLDKLKFFVLNRWRDTFLA